MAKEDTSVTLEETIKRKAEDQAEKENRSLSNLIETAIKEYIESKEG